MEKLANKLDKLTMFKNRILFLFALLFIGNTINAQEATLEKGKEYDIEFKYDLHIPYILVGPQANPLLASSVVHKNLICQ